jgi:hypothetical protein
VFGFLGTEELIDRDVRSSLPGAAEMIDAIVDDPADALKEFDARLPEVIGRFFGCEAGAEEPSDPLVGIAAETMGVIVSVAVGALFFH